MGRVSETYAELVFNEQKLKSRVNERVYESFIKAIKDGDALDEQIADDVAHAMKEWAIENGATHFTHWFQPH